MKLNSKVEKALIMIILKGKLGTERIRRAFWTAGDVLFLDVVDSYIGVFTLWKYIKISTSAPCAYECMWYMFKKLNRRRKDGISLCERAQFNSHLKIGHLPGAWKYHWILVVDIRKFMVIVPVFFYVWKFCNKYFLKSKAWLLKMISIF